MWHEFFIALCLVMVIEGLLPFISPASWRRAMLNAVELDDRSLRMFGLSSMLLGTVLLYWIN